MPNWDKRRDNRLYATHQLKINDIEFKSLNDGAHLQIGKIDFWPGTGLYKDGKIEGQGVEELIQHIKRAKSFVITNRKHECPHCGKEINIRLETI